MSSNDSYSDSNIESNDRLVSSSLSSSNIETDTDTDTDTDTAGEIDINKWTNFPAVNRDPFHFFGNREVQAYGAQTPIEFWNYIFPRNLVQKIVYETNRYAETMCNTLGPRQQYSRLNKWQPTSIEEFNIFLAILILQGIVRKPELQMYFTTDELLATPVFNKILTADRFLMLLKMSHFETDEGSDTKLKKILPIIEGLRSTFKRLYKPGRFLCVDESLYLYKGRLSWKQFIPSKRARFGFKFYMVCGTNGYVLDFIIYTGSDTNYKEKFSNLSVPSRIVMTLVEDYLDLGHCIVMDNYYSSLELFIELVKRKTDAVGTVRSNRRSLPIDFRRTELEKNERIVRYYKKVMVLKWLDKKYVNMLTTYHKDDITIVHKRDTQIEKPTCVHDYNVTRGGVDLASQQIATYSLPRNKMKKYYKKIFMVLLDLAILNSYHLFKIQTHQTDGKMMTQLQFRIALARSLLEYNLHDHLPNQMVRRGRPSIKPTPTRLAGRHFPSIILPNSNGERSRRRCFVCGHTEIQRNRRRRETTYECSVCDVGLCVDPCFRIYHTVLNF